MYSITVHNDGERIERRTTASRRTALVVAMGYRRAVPAARIRVLDGEGTVVQEWDGTKFRYPGGFSRPSADE